MNRQDAVLHELRAVRFDTFPLLCGTESFIGHSYFCGRETEGCRYGIARTEMYYTRFCFYRTGNIRHNASFFTAITALREERKGLIIDDGKQKHITAITNH